MNAHFPITIDLRVKDLHAIQPGELVYCQPTAAIPLPALEGCCQVVEIRDGRVASRSNLDDLDGPLVWESVEVITHHLPGYEYWNGLFAAGPRDAKLIHLGYWMDDLIPLERELWAKCEALRSGLDAISKTAYETDEPYQRALTEHSQVAGCALSLITYAAYKCRASTPAGHAARMSALQYDLTQGSEWASDRMISLAEEARAIADWEQPRLTIGKTLTDLIEAHRQAETAFSVAVDLQSAASAAWDKLRAKNVYTTPTRIRDGKVLTANEVSGNVDDDRAIIDREHDRWALDFALGKVRDVSPAAAKLIKEQVETSRAECHRLYDTETLPALKIARADFDPVDAAYNAAYEAEIAALEALNRYRPTDLAEVGELARYLLTTDFYDGCNTAEFASQFMVTLSTLGSTADLHSGASAP